MGKERASGSWKEEAKDATKHPTMCRTAPPHPYAEKNHLAQNVYSAEIEKLSLIVNKFTQVP